MTKNRLRHRFPLLIDSPASRPDHEAVRSALAEFLGLAFGAAPGQATPEPGMPDYLQDQECQWKRPFVGIATDGAMGEALEFRGAAMASLGRARAEPDRPVTPLAALEPALSERGAPPADAGIGPGMPR